MPSVWAAFGNITRVPPGAERSLDLEIDIRYRYKGFLHKMPLRGNCIQFAIIQDHLSPPHATNPSRTNVQDNIKMTSNWLENGFAWEGGETIES